MREYSVISIRPQEHIASKVNKFFSKSTLRHCEQLALKNVLASLPTCDLSQAIHSLNDDESLSLELCPKEAMRFGACLENSVRESITVTYEPLDGHQKSSAIPLGVMSKKLEKSFQIYASGSYRREKIRKEFGKDLELLIARQESESRDEIYSVTIDVQWHELEGLPQVLTFTTARNSDNWIAYLIEESASGLVNDLNEHIKVKGA
jgi:hypothetical protein